MAAPAVMHVPRPRERRIPEYVARGRFVTRVSQEMAETLDSQLQHAGYLNPGVRPFGAWVLHRTMRDMLWWIHLGFELELFAPCEYAFVYWCDTKRSRRIAPLGVGVHARDRLSGRAHAHLDHIHSCYTNIR